MTLAVHLFNAEARLVGRSVVNVDLAAVRPTCAALRMALVQAEPKLEPALARCRIAVNCAFATDEQLLRDGDEVALIGMVSGG